MNESSILIDERTLFYKMLDGEIEVNSSNLKKLYQLENKQWIYGGIYNIINSQLDCLHDCAYCYVKSMPFKRAQMKKRDDKIQDIEDLFRKSVTGSSILKKGPIVINQSRELNRIECAKAFDTDKRKIDHIKISKPKTSVDVIDKKIVMFPTSHDIYDTNVEDYITVSKKIMDSGKIVLCVTKAFFSTIKKLCDGLMTYRDRFIMRFSITSSDQNILDQWETTASTFNERLEGLKFAFDKGYNTSVSVEPMLGNPDQLIDQILPYVRGSIWIGPMDKPIQYVKRVGLDNVNNIISFYSKKNITRIVNKYRSNPKIFWKTKIFKIVFTQKELYTTYSQFDLRNYLESKLVNSKKKKTKQDCKSFFESNPNLITSNIIDDPLWFTKAFDCFCEPFKNKPNINPITNRKLNTNGKVYSSIKKWYDKNCSIIEQKINLIEKTQNGILDQHDGEYDNILPDDPLPDDLVLDDPLPDDPVLDDPLLDDPVVDDPEVDDLAGIVIEQITDFDDKQTQSNDHNKWKTLAIDCICKTYKSDPSVNPITGIKINDKSKKILDSWIAKWC